MSNATIAAIAAANAHLAHTTVAPITVPKARKAPQHTWQMTKAERRARYAENRAFWTGPATKSQRQRIVDNGGTLFEGMLAFEAAEEFAAIGARANGKRFHRIVRKSA